MVASDLRHPENLVDSHISHAELLDLIPDDRDTKFCKRQVNVCDIDKINKNLTYQREKHMGKDEKPVTAVYIPLNFPWDD